MTDDRRAILKHASGFCLGVVIVLLVGRFVLAPLRYVQNATRHAWRNRSSEPCNILVVLIGTRREPKYAKRLKESSNIVVLRPEVAEAFPNEEAVNSALLSLIDLAKRTTRPARRSTGSAKKPASR